MFKKGKRDKKSEGNAFYSEIYSEDFKIMLESDQVETIIQAYDHTTIPYEYDSEFRTWLEGFPNEKEKELETMNVDIDCFDVFVNEINANVCKAKNLAANQFYAHITAIRKLMRVLSGKIQRFKDYKMIVEEDLEECLERFDVLNNKKKNVEGA